MLKKILISSLLSSSLIYASSVEINLNNDTLEAAGEMYLNDSYVLNENADYFLTVSYLTSEDNSTNSSSLFNVGLKMMNPYVNDRGFTFGFGMKALNVDTDTMKEQDFWALPLSVFGSFHFSEKISFDGEYNYAPKILAFSDADSYNGLKLNANYSIMDTANLLLGTRSIKASYTNGKSYKFDSSIFFGFKAIF